LERGRLALGLLLYTAQRRSDVVLMGWQHLVGDSIKVKQSKTGADLLIPIHAELRLVLQNLARTNLTFLVTERGSPFSTHSFGGWFKKECKLAGLPHCSAHGLRKSASRRLAEAGCSASQIAAEVSNYTKAADQKLLARQAFERLEEERKLSNPQNLVVQPAKK
jgi:integrase